MKISSRHYRLKDRNIEWGHAFTPAFVSKPNDQTSLALGRLLQIKTAAATFYDSQVDEYLSRITPESVRIWERTCAWARVKSPSNAQIYHARALAPWLESEDNQADEARQIIQVDKSAENAETELRLLSAALKSPDIIRPGTWWGKLGALALREQSEWATQNRPIIFEEALKSSHQSYLFASSVTPTDKEWFQLTDLIAISPRFSFLTLQLPHVVSKTTPGYVYKSLQSAVRRDAILDWVMLMNEPQVNALSLAEKILTDATPTPHLAALALTINPRHQRASEWMNVIEYEPELAYFVRFVLHEVGPLEAELEHANSLFRIAAKEARWFFMWIRDFGENAEDDALSLRPNYDWIAELIQLKALPPLIAVQIEADLDREAKDHPLRLSFVAFAAAQLNSND